MSPLSSYVSSTLNTSAIFPISELVEANGEEGLYLTVSCAESTDCTSGNMDTTQKAWCSHVNINTLDPVPADLF